MLKPESSHGWLLACRLLLLLWLLAYLLSHFGLHPARLGLGATSHWPLGIRQLQKNANKG